MGDFKKEAVIFMINLLIILFVSSVSAGFFDFINEGLTEITGEATSQTTSLTLTIGNTQPALQLLEINTSDAFEGGNYTNETIWGSFVPADDDPGESDLTCEFRWFKDGDNTVNFTSISCTNGTRIVYPLMSANTTHYENWSFEGFVDDQSSNSTGVASINLSVLNAPPEGPVYLSGPENNSIYFDTPGIPDLNWSNSSDIDNDTLIYYLEVDNDWDFSSPTYANSGITETANVTSDTSVTGLSLNTDYWWRVLVYDEGGNTSWSEVRNFTYANRDPITPTVVTFNSTDLGNYTNESLWCGFTPDDPDPGEDDLLCNFWWMKNNASHLEVINIDCTDETFIVRDLSSGNTSRGEEWTCGVQINDGNSNTTWVNSTNIMVIQNSFPSIYNIDFNITMSVTEGQTKVYFFSFLANDSDGLSDLGSNAVGVNGNITRGATTHGNTTCEFSNDDADSGYSNYTCNISLNFFDPAGVYDVYVSLSDAAGAYIQNETRAYLDEATSVSFNVSSMTFGTVVAASTNRTPTNNPFTLRNIANDPINDSNINVTAVDILGDTDDTESMPALNFTVDIEGGGSGCSDAACTECDQTFMPGNNTMINITGATLDIGAYVLEDLYFCLVHVPDSAGEQDYTTDGDGEKWTVTIG